MGGNFREKLEKAIRIKFRGFKFRSTLLYFFAHNVMQTLNSRGAHDANFRFDEERVARLSPASV